MTTSRRSLLVLGLCLAGAACGGGGTSRLVTVRSATGSGPVEFEVRNQTDVPINNLYLAKTSVVDKAAPEDLIPGASKDPEIWGPDLLTSALEIGGKEIVQVPEPGLYDLRCIDRDGRYQHVAGLKLGAGGRFILELHDGSWRVAH
jgi:hypothetical protein